MTQAYKTCPQCDKPNAMEAQVCQHCGYAFAPEVAAQSPPPQAPYGSFAPAPPPAYPPIQQGYPTSQQQGYAPVPQQGASNKLAAGICGILLGGLGIHKFILGMNTAGIIMLLVSLVGAWFTCGISAGVMGIIGLIEGIIYLTKSDADFYQTYVVEKKQWF